MSIENIKPNPLVSSSLGSATSSWATGVFHEGHFGGSVTLQSMELTCPVAGELHISADGSPAERFAFPADLPTNTSEISNDERYIGADNITGVVQMSQAAYDSLTTKDALTLYLITD